MTEILFEDYLRMAETYSRYESARKLADRFPEFPRTRKEQEGFLECRYRSPLDGKVYLNRKPIESCSDAQVYAVTRRVLDEVWKEAAIEPDMDLPDDLAGIVKSCIRVGTDTLVDWLNEAERESILSEDEQTYSPEQHRMIRYELTRRKLPYDS